jgi:hypothetical protein
VDVVLLEDDPELADQEIRQLRRELAAEFETRPVPVIAPGGAKGDAEAIGAVAVALGGAGGTVSLLVALLRDWLGRRRGSGAVRLTVDGKSIELDRATVDERQQLIEAFLRSAGEK